jgi:sigma-B regulation protein RsbU (phosphoserine phosphatase)
MDSIEKKDYRVESSIDEILDQFRNLEGEAEQVRDSDRVIIRGLLGNFYGKRLNVGIGMQRAYGAVLSGDYFELFKLPDGNYLFVFADISGHGLPAYTTLVRLRSALTLSVKESQRKLVEENTPFSAEDLVRDAGTKFTDIMDAAGSPDFASLIFTYIRNEGDKYYLRFFNRGMYFPLVVRKFQNSLVSLYDLNEQEQGWLPTKGYLLGSEFRRLLGEKYDVYPSCEFIIYEGDMLMFLSDGITEAQKKDNKKEDFGMEKVKKILLDNYMLFPQAIVNTLYDEVYEYMGDMRKQSDDMTAVIIDFPLVR